MADERVIIEIELDDGSVKRSFAKVRKEAKKTGKVVEKSISGGFSKTIATLTRRLGALALGFASLQGIRKVARDFIDFERALAGVAKTTDITGSDLKELGKDFQRISSEIPVTTNELLRLAQVAGQFGVRGTENITKFAEVIGKLQFAIEGIDPESAAQALTRILNITGQGVKNIDRLAASVVALGNNFEATEGEIITIANEVTRSTAGFGISAQDTIAIGTALKAVGVQAQSGGTSVGKALRLITKAVAKGGEDLQKFTKIIGLTATELKEQLGKDAVGVFEKLIKGLGRTGTSAVRLNKALTSLGLTDERVIKSIVPLVQANDKLTDALRLSRKAYIENTALQIEFDRVNQTISASLTKLNNDFTTLSQTIGSQLAPTLRATIDTFRTLTQVTTNFFKESSESFAVFIRNFKALAVTAATVLLIVFNQKILLAFTLGLARIGLVGKLVFTTLAVDINRVSVSFKLARLSGATFFASIRQGALASNIAIKALAVGVRSLKLALSFGLLIGLDLLLLRIFEVDQKIKDLGKSVKVVGKEIQIALIEAFTGAFITISENKTLTTFLTAFSPALGALVKSFGNLGVGVSFATDKVKELKDEIQALFDLGPPDDDDDGPLSEDNLQGILDRVDKFADKVGNGAKKAGKNFNKALGAGIASGVQQFTNALIKGENVFEAFGKAVLSVFGDLAIQIGQFFIIQGIAIESLKSVSGTGAIAAGLALVALGTILKSIGGSASAPAGGGVVASGATGAVDDDTSVDPDELQEPGQQIQINVEGTVIDPKTTGQQIADVLEEFFDSTGSRIVTVA